MDSGGIDNAPFPAAHYAALWQACQQKMGPYAQQ